MKEFCKLIGINKSKSSRLHPQGDGAAEAFVKILKGCIQKQVDRHGSDWDLYNVECYIIHQLNLFFVPLCYSLSTSFLPIYPPKQPYDQKQYSLSTSFFQSILRNNHTIKSNTAYQQVSSNLSSETTIRSKAIQPINKFLPIYPPKQPYDQKQATLFEKNLIKTLDTNTHTVRHELDQYRSRLKSQYDKNIHYSHLHVDSTVMLWNPGKKVELSKCFQSKQMVWTLDN